MEQLLNVRWRNDTATSTECRESASIHGTGHPVVHDDFLHFDTGVWNHGGHRRRDAHNNGSAKSNGRSPRDIKALS